MLDKTLFPVIIQPIILVLIATIMSIEHLLTKPVLEKVMEREMTRRDFGQTIVGVAGTANEGTIRTAENLAFSLGRIGRIEDKVGELGGWLRVFRERGAKAPAGQETNEADQQILRDVMVAVGNTTAMYGAWVWDPGNPMARRRSGRFQPLSDFQTVAGILNERLAGDSGARVGVASIGVSGEAQVDLGVDNSDLNAAQNTISTVLDISGGFNRFSGVLSRAVDDLLLAGRPDVGDKLIVFLPLTSTVNDEERARLIGTADQIRQAGIDLTVIYGHEPNYYNPERDLQDWVIPVVQAAGGRLVKVQDILEDPTLIDQHLRPNAPGWISSGEGSVSVVPTPTPVTNP